MIYVPYRFRWTPPRLLRFVTPWALLSAIDGRLNTCWSGMVMWKLGYPDWSWWPSCTCFSDSWRDFDGYDFCGKYATREAFEKAQS